MEMLNITFDKQVQEYCALRTPALNTDSEYYATIEMTSEEIKNCDSESDLWGKLKGKIDALLLEHPELSLMIYVPLLAAALETPHRSISMYPKVKRSCIRFLPNRDVFEIRFASYPDDGQKEEKHHV